MDRRPLGRSELVIEPLVLGGNVFGWTVDKDAGFAVLDAFVGEGFTAIDTADVYGKGKSETMIGEWLKARGNRQSVHIFTKLGGEMTPDKRGLRGGLCEAGGGGQPQAPPDRLYRSLPEPPAGSRNPA